MNRLPVFLWSMNLTFGFLITILFTLTININYTQMLTIFFGCSILLNQFSWWLR